MPFCPNLSVLPTFDIAEKKNRISNERGVEKLIVSDEGGGGCVAKFSVQMHTGWQ